MRRDIKPTLEEIILGLTDQEAERQLNVACQTVSKIVVNDWEMEEGNE